MKVEVRTSNGESYTVDQVIVALPLGVLQKRVNEENLFNFPLSPRKTTALQNWGIGQMGWIFMAFPYPFWPQEMFNGYGFLQNDPFNNTNMDLEAGDDWTKALYSATNVVHR